MADEKEILWGMYQLNMEHSRHHQDQRAGATNIVLVLAVGILAFIAADQKIAGNDYYLAWVMVGIGIYGALWNAKHHERVAFFRERARGYRKRLDQLLPEAKLVATQEAADEKTKKKYGWRTTLRLWHLWLVLDLAITLIGVMLLLFMT